MIEETIKTYNSIDIYDEKYIECNTVKKIINKKLINMTGIGKRLEKVLQDDAATLTEIIQAQEGIVSGQNWEDFNEENPYLKPILLEGKLLSSLRELGIPISENTYLWTKLCDFQLHPNDYPNFENPLEFSGDEDWVALSPTQRLHFEFIMSKCNGLTKISDILEDTKLMQDAKLAKIMKRNKSEKDMKFHEIMSVYIATNCTGCHHPHYFVGKGVYVINSSFYEGTHLVLDPDYNPEDLFFNEGVKDHIYREFLSEKGASFIKEKRSEYVVKYISQLKEIVYS